MPHSPLSLTDYIQAMPKVELHLHLEGSLRPATMLKLATRNRLRMPFTTIEMIEARLYNFRNFQEFIPALLMGVECLRRPEDFRDAVLALGRELADQNVRYAEVTWTPQFYRRLGLPFDAILAALNEGRREVEESRGVKIGWLVDLVRSVPGPAGEVTAWACSDKARAGGIVALGLGGPEATHSAAPFAEHFRLAKTKGLAANPHAGEGGGPESIRAALNLLGASRIGHGVRACEDPALMALLAEQQVVLEICPTSNLRLGLYPSYAGHPLKRLVAAGCQVTINSDDPALFRTTLSEEYRHAVTDCGLTLDELKASVLRAVRGSHQNQETRREMAAAFRAEFNRLDAGEVQDRLRPERPAG